MLEKDPESRITAGEALGSEVFDESSKFMEMAIEEESFKSNSFQEFHLYFKIGFDLSKQPQILFLKRLLIQQTQ